MRKMGIALVGVALLIVATAVVGLAAAPAHADGLTYHSDDSHSINARSIHTASPLVLFQGTWSGGSASGVVTINANGEASARGLVLWGNPKEITVDKPVPYKPDSATAQRAPDGSIIEIVVTLSNPRGQHDGLLTITPLDSITPGDLLLHRWQPANFSLQIDGRVTATVGEIRLVGYGLDNGFDR
jgi:hypothetical protein